MGFFYANVFFISNATIQNNVTYRPGFSLDNLKGTAGSKTMCYYHSNFDSTNTDRRKIIKCTLMQTCGTTSSYL